MIWVYISSYDKDAANNLADQLEAEGFKVRSLWHRNPTDPPDLFEVNEWKERTGHEFYFIRVCDVHVTLTDRRHHSGAADRESGYAQGAGKRCAILGPVTNGSQWHGAVRQFYTAGLLIEWLRSLCPVGVPTNAPT